MDLLRLDLSHNDAFVIIIQVVQAMVDRIDVDEGSVVNILQLLVVQHIGMENLINKSARPLTSFNGSTSITVGTIDLDVYSPLVVNTQTFMIIEAISPTMVMLFGMKNVGATYQMLVNKIFKKQIGKTIEVYVDDMLVKAP
ncbi:uncharacterized protein LOC117630291 [Prunus dulcis]|uniref:uncharacterized protein LOC117630291 n=1 Tax=Prunus dulcis TaxID=3755 RepID=UPI0014836ED3|nr:uncharacterized protein LOC117630291 [Prunus dulcis]